MIFIVLSIRIKSTAYSRALTDAFEKLNGTKTVVILSIAIVFKDFDGKIITTYLRET
jgi:hypothetical protein